MYEYTTIRESLRACEQWENIQVPSSFVQRETIRFREHLAGEKRIKADRGRTDEA
jgi:hypothetical protein